MTRLRYNDLNTGAAGALAPLALGASLTSSATAVTFNAALSYANGTAVPTIVSPDYIPLSILDSTGTYVTEIVYLTAYTAAATSGTILRAQEGYAGVAHASGDKISHGATTLDFGGSGTGSGGSFVGVRATRSAALTLTSGAVTPFPFDAEDFDTNTFHDNTTNSDRLTVPTGQAGKYLVVAGFNSVGQVASGTRVLGHIQKNGTMVPGSRMDITEGAVAYVSATTTVLVDLAVGDYIQFAYYASATATVDQAAISMHKVDGGSTGVGTGTGAGTILAVTVYNPSTNPAVSAATTLPVVADVDATNLVVTFTAPASGNVIVRLHAVAGNWPSSVGAYLAWALRESTTTIITKNAIQDSSNVVRYQPTVLEFYLTGLTGSHTYKWAHGSNDSATPGSIHYGGIHGQAVMTVTAAP